MAEHQTEFDLGDQADGTESVCLLMHVPGFWLERAGNQRDFFDQLLKQWEDGEGD